MNDLSKDDIAKPLLAAFEAIGIEFEDTTTMLKYKIAALNKELGKTAGSDWNLPTTSFARVIKIEFFRRGYEILDFDSDWFNANKTATVSDLVDFIDSHYAAL